MESGLLNQQQDAGSASVSSDLQQSDQPGSRLSSSRSKLVIVATTVVVVAVIVTVLFTLQGNKGTGSTSNTAASTTAISSPQVDIGAKGFIPATISITVGQSVTWKNTDVNMKAHSVASDPYPTDNELPGLNSRESIKPGDTYSYVFSKAGTYSYHDNLNPSFTGTVLVKS